MTNKILKEEVEKEFRWIKRCIGDMSPIEDRWDIGYREALRWVLAKMDIEESEIARGRDITQL